jgi:aquaporin Z
MTQPVRSYLAEFIGTFTLVFMGTATAVLNNTDFAGKLGPSGWLGISFAFGGTLMFLVWTIGPVSGCHLNPAVTIPMALSGRLPMARALPYIVAQCAGATAASFVLFTLLKGIPAYKIADHGLAANGAGLGMSLMTMCGWEILFTALFLLTIFTVTHKNAPVGFAAIAIGGFLFIAHVVGAQLGDASLNPARSLGPAVIQSVMGGGNGGLEALWPFCVGPIVGGLIGWQLFNVIHGENPT